MSREREMDSAVVQIIINADDDGDTSESSDCCDDDDDIKELLHFPVTASNTGNRETSCVNGSLDFNPSTKGKNCREAAILKLII